jgi:hypothetical protein
MVAVVAHPVHQGLPDHDMDRVQHHQHVRIASCMRSKVVADPCQRSGCRVDDTGISVRGLKGRDGLHERPNDHYSVFLVTKPRQTVNATRRPWKAHSPATPRRGREEQLADAVARWIADASGGFVADTERGLFAADAGPPSSSRCSTPRRTSRQSLQQRQGGRQWALLGRHHRRCRAGRDGRLVRRRWRLHLHRIGSHQLTNGPARVGPGRPNHVPPTRPAKN